jgi:hypothetical protein
MPIKPPQQAFQVVQKSTRYFDPDPKVVEKVVEKIVEKPIYSIVEKTVEVESKDLLERYNQVLRENAEIRRFQRGASEAKIVEVPVEKIIEKIIEVKVTEPFEMKIAILTAVFSAGLLLGWRLL